MRPGPARRTPQNFLPRVQTPLRAPQRLPNLGGARLQRGSAGGDHRQLRRRAGEEAAPQRVPGTLEQPPRRCGVGKSGGACPRGRGPCSRRADSRGASREPPSFRFPESGRREAAAARAAGSTQRRRSGNRAAGPGQPPEREGRGGGLRGKKKRTEQKERKRWGKGRCLVPPRCAPAPRTSRLCRHRDCGDLWKEQERRGNSPSRPSSLSLAPAPELAPGDARAGEKALFPGTSPARDGSLGPSGCLALRPTPALPASANARDSRITPVQGSPPSQNPFKFQDPGLLPAELWEGGDCPVCVLCFSSMLVTIASTGCINRFL